MTQPPPPGPAQPPHHQGPPEPPYRPWGQGYSPQLRPWPVSGFAVASLVCGILCFVPGVGLVLGLVALRRIRRRRERGRGMAITGAVLSCVGLALWGLVIATGGDGPDFGVRGGAAGGSGVSLVKGECFDVPGDSLDGVMTGEVERVPCGKRHDGEVFGVLRMTGIYYPGPLQLRTTAEAKCPALLDRYALDRWAVPVGVQPYHLTPTPRGWDLGDRGIACVFGREGVGLTGSLRSDATTLDADQVAFLKAAHVLDLALDAQPARGPGRDLPGARRWAVRVAAALGREAGQLRAHRWPAAAGKPVAGLRADLERAEGAWALAAASPDVGTFAVRRARASALIDPFRFITARKALGLAAVPPTPRDGAADVGGGGTDPVIEV
ncbi:DUF4190 domain-containing protein [Streptomyces sp. NPDC096152]|uniref:DUF4190 domain-containing protein n=1 Tax=Streptomyces sp. NPDC096152 TaxID=3366078 RepID=UPI00382ED1A7